MHMFLRVVYVLGAVKKTTPKWRDARIARTHGNILNLSYAYVYYAYKFKVAPYGNHLWRCARKCYVAFAFTPSPLKLITCNKE